MIELLLFLLFTGLAGVFWAICDRVENENFYNSVFRDMNERFWYKRTSWKYAKKIFGWKLDAWHISKSLCIICFLCASYYSPPFPLPVLVGFGGGWYVLAFNLFYNQILYRK